MTQRSLQEEKQVCAANDPTTLVITVLKKDTRHNPVGSYDPTRHEDRTSNRSKYRYAEPNQGGKAIEGSNRSCQRSLLLLEVIVDATAPRINCGATQKQKIAATTGSSKMDAAELEARMVAIEKLVRMAEIAIDFYTVEDVDVHDAMRGEHLVELRRTRDRYDRATEEICLALARLNGGDEAKK